MVPQTLQVSNNMHMCFIHFQKWFSNIFRCVLEVAFPFFPFLWVDAKYERSQNAFIHRQAQCVRSCRSFYNCRFLFSCRRFWVWVNWLPSRDPKLRGRASLHRVRLLSFLNNESQKCSTTFKNHGPKSGAILRPQKWGGSCAYRELAAIPGPHKARNNS
jgi:hypothetical protein